MNVRLLEGRRWEMEIINMQYTEIARVILNIVGLGVARETQLCFLFLSLSPTHRHRLTYPTLSSLQSSSHRLRTGKVILINAT